jgi:two-component system NtrC family sensor kinase
VTETSSPSSSTEKVGRLWALLAVALLIPVALLGFAAWQSRENSLLQANATAERTALVLQGHAQNIFDTFDLAMDRIEDRLHGLTSDEIQGSNAIHAFLKEIAADRSQIGTIWLFDAAGDARNSSLVFPAMGVNVADRDYMKSLRAGHRGIFIGEPIIGRATGNPIIPVARAHYDRDGRFAGAIVITAYLRDFESFYSRSLPPPNWGAGLVRGDGVFLVPEISLAAPGAGSRAGASVLGAIAAGGQGSWVDHSAIDGRERIVAYRKLDRYPVYALYALGTNSILARWRRQVLLYALVAVPGMIGLVTMMILALARTQRAQAAARRLAEEMRRREASEEKLAKAQRMEALGQLTGGIAHDFNNLLTVVLGSVDLLRRAPEERRERLINSALQAVEQGRKLTSQLLAFGRRQTLHPEPVDLSHLVRSMDEMLARTLRGDIRCEFDLAEGLDAVEVDPSQLQIALINLAANARDAMPKGGTFRVRTYAPSASGGRVMALEVTDTGIGMSPDVLARVGEPFFTTKAVGKGTGLGLAQVFGFAQQSGGSVELRSAPGEGTTVTLLLPRTQNIKRSSQAASNDEAAAEPIQPAHILLVEDNEQVADVAKLILAEQGHSVVHAPNAVEALAILSRDADRFDLLFSDLVMPGPRDGLDLARAVRREWPDLPVILATGYSDAAARAKRDGFALISKPYEPEIVDRTIRDTVGERRRQRPDAGAQPSARAMSRSDHGASAQVL